MMIAAFLKEQLPEHERKSGAFELSNRAESDDAGALTLHEEVTCLDGFEPHSPLIG
jgi:hypothetical protein